MLFHHDGDVRSSLVDAETAALGAGGENLYGFCCNVPIDLIDVLGWMTYVYHGERNGKRVDVDIEIPKFFADESNKKKLSILSYVKVESSCHATPEHPKIKKLSDKFCVIRFHPRFRPPPQIREHMPNVNKFWGD